MTFSGQRNFLTGPDIRLLVKHPDLNFVLKALAAGKKNKNKKNISSAKPSSVNICWKFQGESAAHKLDFAT